MPTLQDILKKKKEQDERVKVDFDWFSLKEKNPIRIQFLQDLSEDSTGYDSTRGAVLFLSEHTSARDFKRRAVCSMDAEGRCFGCEMQEAEPYVIEDGKKIYGKWAAKTNLYVQVVTEDGDVKVLSRPAPGNFFDQILREHNEENDNTLLGETYTIEKGKNKSDPWRLSSTKRAIAVPDDVKLVDLSVAVERKIPYEEQKAFYLPDGSTKSEETPAKETDDAPDW